MQPQQWCKQEWAANDSKDKWQPQKWWRKGEWASGMSLECADASKDQWQPQQQEWADNADWSQHYDGNNWHWGLSEHERQRLQRSRSLQPKRSRSPQPKRAPASIKPASPKCSGFYLQFLS